MTEYVSKRTARRIEKFTLDFAWKSNPNAGFGFDCDKDGSVILNNEAATENYRKCTDGTFDVVCTGVHDYSWTVYDAAVIKCECDARLSLEDSWANECDRCHREYNGFGQLLAPRSQWGEETGETFAAHNWSNDY